MRRPFPRRDAASHVASPRSTPPLKPPARPGSALHGPFTAALALAAFGMTPSGACAQEQQTGEGKPEVVIIQATRSGRALEDEPIRVDVVDQEEVSEKQVMTPGNIAMLVNETVGVRVQVTSPALGASNIRMQGMNGKYASLLADGLPLYGGQTSSLGLLQVPPTDLGQVEVIKGAASALYGPSALGGVINLVSRRPGEEVQGEVYANLTRRDGQDLTGYVATPINESLGVAMTGGYSRQSQVDIDRDGWADMPAYDRWTARPRMFWNGEGGASAFITAGAMREQRQGGTLPGRAVSDGRPFIQSQDTTRLDTGLVAEFPIENTGVLHLRGSAMRQDHDHRFGDVLEKDRHSTSFAEASLSGDRGRTSLLGGLAFQSDSYRSESFPTFNYTYDTPALFGQIEHKVFDDLVLAVSGRVDAHSEYGTFFSPRLSALYKPGDFTMRASLGRGFYAPTPFVEETEANGLSRLAPLSGLRAETANTSSIDLGYRFRGGWQANVTVFGSDIRNAVRLENTGGTTGPAVRLVNVAGVTATRGAELTARFRWREVTVNGSYVYVDATEPDTDGRGRREVPVTPKQAGGVDFMWERPGRSRLGFEAYYTGSQSLEDNPYRSRARPYLLLGLMGELSFENISVFVNAENLLDIRQTSYDPLLRSQRTTDGAWTVDAWGPLEGLMVNAGARIRFGGR